MFCYELKTEEYHLCTHLVCEIDKVRTFSKLLYDVHVKLIVLHRVTDIYNVVNMNYFSVL